MIASVSSLVSKAQGSAFAISMPGRLTPSLTRSEVGLPVVVGLLPVLSLSLPVVAVACTVVPSCGLLAEGCGVVASSPPPPHALSSTSVITRNKQALAETAHVPFGTGAPNDSLELLLWLR